MTSKKFTVNSNLVLLASIISVIGCMLMNIPLYAGFFVGIILTALSMYTAGFKIKQIFNTMVSSIVEIKGLILVILLIGATTTVWISSGVIPTIMYYGFNYMNGVNFMLAAFLIMTVVSIFMGTAVGTISTVGIALMGIGLGLGIPPEMLIGVLVSGAFVADKISPLSGLLNLTMSTVKRNYLQIIKSFSITLIPLIIITAIIYCIMGSQYTVNNYSSLEVYKEAIINDINISPFLLLMPILMVVLSLVGLKSTVTIGIGVVCGGIFSVLMQDMSILETIKSIMFGYSAQTTSAELNSILVSGGVISMVDVILIVVGSVVLVGLFEKSNVLGPIINKLISKVNSKFQLILKTGILSSLMTIITCDQTVGIILPGKVLQDKYEEFSIDSVVLARTISDTGTIIAPLMVWNVNSFIIDSVTGVSALGYAPYAVLCYLCPVITIIISWLIYRRKQKELS